MISKSNPATRSLRPYSGLRVAHWAGAVASGLTLTAAFPPPGLSWFAWVGLVPLFKTLEGQAPRDGMKLGIAFGLAHFGTLLYWIVYVVRHYAGLNIWLSFFPFLLLTLYLSLYGGVFGALCALQQNRAFASVGIPASWVALEFLRAKLLTGFPWCLLGYSQYKWETLIQAAQIAGVYGISFLVVSANWAVFNLMMASGKTTKKATLASVLFSVLMMALTLFYGHTELKTRAKRPVASSLNVLLVQPNIDQSKKWAPGYQLTTIKILEHLTKKGVEGQDTDLIVWPETATPFFFQEKGKLSNRVRNLSKELETPILFGSPAYEYTPHGRIYLNRAYLLGPDPNVVQWYDKMHLVPFGEYVPMKKVLFFLEKLVHGAGDFQPGKEVKPLKTKGAKLGVLICFETIFPGIAREHITRGAQCLVNITNDAWFGKSSAPLQHLAMSVFRAVEYRVPLIRAANTGISAVVTPSGEILRKSGLFTRETIRAKLDLYPTSLTPYALFGDLFSVASLLISSLWFLWNLMRK